VGLERGPLSLVRTTEDPLRWPRNTLYPQKLALLGQQAAVVRSV
jgi:hypothetical protein